MFVVLSKILFFLIQPFTWVIALLIYSFYAKSPKRRKKLRLTCLILLLFFGNNFIANEVMNLWEVSPKLIKDLPKQPYDVGIVLTGVTNSGKKPYDRVHFNKGADRVTQTVQLYKLKKIKKILVTGGTGRLTGVIRQEAPLLKKVLIDCGVDKNDIMIEPNSRNTYENALFSTDTLKKLYPEEKTKYLLITSAFHMRRSVACFKKQGLNVTPYSVDYYTSERKWTPDQWLIPQAGAFFRWKVLLKEWVGYIVYDMTGRI